MTHIAITFRTMTSTDIPSAMELCRTTQWNQLPCDWEFLLQHGAPGCRVAEHEGRLVGTVSTASYEDRFAWIGMMLIAPEMRGQGIGTQLLQQAIALLPDFPSIRLDASPAGYPLYRKLGFADEYTLSRLELTTPKQEKLSGHTVARPMQREDLPAVFAWDRQVFGANRSHLLEWMFTGAPEYAWVIEEKNKLVGYLFGRHGFGFEHLGPVIARDQKLAEQLVIAGLQQQTHKPFVIDAWQELPAWRAWLEAIGFREQRPFTRMFYRANPFPGLPQNQFGILGPEFG